MTDLKIELPDGFLNEEIRCGYTVTEQMKRVWAVELDLLCELLRVCDKYELHCYADAGTLLGAVRHKGFIPWDDDIDVVMFREDYEKLKRIADIEFGDPYFFQTAYTDNQYTYGHAQLRNIKTTGILESEKDKKKPFVQGIFIDIFVLDGVLKNAFVVWCQHKLINFADQLIRCLLSSEKNLRWRARMAVSALKRFKIDYRMVYRCREWILQWGKVQKCEDVAPLGFIFETQKRIRKKALYDKTVWLGFEHMKIPAPAEYDVFLHQRYGKYMEYKQISTTHGQVIFDVDKPYTEYFR